MTDNDYKCLPDYDFRTQYDATPRPDKDVEAALRGEFDKPAEVGGPMASDGIRWMSNGPQRIR